MGCMPTKIYREELLNEAKFHVPIHILLIFPQSDKQTRLLLDAAQQLKQNCQLLITGDEFKLDEFKSLSSEQIVDLVIIDMRQLCVNNNSVLNILNRKSIGYTNLDEICKQIRELDEARDSVICALISRQSSPQQKLLILDKIFKSGCNKYINEPTCQDDVYNEIINFMNNELRLLNRVRQLTDPTKDNQKLNCSLPNSVTDEQLKPITEDPDKLNNSSSNTSSLVKHQDSRKSKRNSDISDLLKPKTAELLPPMSKVVTLLNSVRTRAPPPIAKELQKAINLICDSDQSGEFVVPSALNSTTDQITTDLIEGLMTDAKPFDEPDHAVKVHSYVRPLKKTTNTHRLGSTLHTNDEIEHCLSIDNRWDFDVFALERLTAKKPLTYLGMKILTRFNATNFLQIHDQILQGWLAVIEDHYHADNPYHNSTHAADVLHASAYFLQHNLIRTILGSIDEVATLLAAVIHDVDHPGKTNPFLINSGDQLAILYNDMAVLESHHVALSFELTRKVPGINIFQNLSREEYRTMRMYIIDMVLATEMAKHFDHVTKFVSTLGKPAFVNNKHHDRSSVGSMSSVESYSVSVNAGTNLTQEQSALTMEHLTSPEIRSIVKRLIIKCADVSNPARPLEICKQWATRIAEEYFSQTEEEKRLNLPIVMPNFDRQTCDISQSQISFVDFFLKGMFSAFDSVFPIPELLHHLESNSKYWTSQVKN